MILDQVAAAAAAAANPELGVLGGPCAVYTMLTYIGVQVLGGILHRFGVNVPVLSPILDGIANLIARSPTPTTPPAPAK